MNVGELEKIEKSLFPLLQSYRDKIITDVDINGRKIDNLYHIKEHKYGYIGLMCPYCFDFIIRFINFNTTLSIENEEPTDTSDIEMDIYNHLGYHKRICNTCNKMEVSMIPIDPNIADCISTLNKKGYLTKFCCEGHGDNHTTGYILFKGKDIIKHLHSLPLTWNFDYAWILNYDMVRIASEASNYVESILDLREWVNELPNKK